MRARSTTSSSIGQRRGQVEDLCPEDIRDGEISAGTKLYVWMRAAGNKAALERLVDERRLPLRHVWSKKAGPFWNVVETIRVSGDDLSDTDIQGLMREASERGFFDWRTYSNKEHLESGLWKITIIDRLGQRIECRKTAAECEIFVDVR